MNIELIKQKSGIVGESEEINQVLEMVSQVAGVDISVLINGESGTGKELVAKAIHTASMRSSKDLIIVNCGAIPEGIIESELFGLGSTPNSLLGHGFRTCAIPTFLSIVVKG